MSKNLNWKNLTICFVEYFWFLHFFVDKYCLSFQVSLQLLGSLGSGLSQDVDDNSIVKLKIISFYAWSICPLHFHWSGKFLLRQIRHLRRHRLDLLGVVLSWAGDEWTAVGGRCGGPQLEEVRLKMVSWTGKIWGKIVKFYEFDVIRMVTISKEESGSENPELKLESGRKPIIILLLFLEDLKELTLLVVVILLAFGCWA